MTEMTIPSFSYKFEGLFVLLPNLLGFATTFVFAICYSSHL